MLRRLGGSYGVASAPLLLRAPFVGVAMRHSSSTGTSGGPADSAERKEANVDAVNTVVTPVGPTEPTAPPEDKKSAFREREQKKFGMGPRTEKGPAPEPAAKTGPMKELPKLKVKRKDPWGKPQLRDSWSVDAMSRHDKDSVGDRIKREYRYHPNEGFRQALKWTFIFCCVSLPFFVAGMYYVIYEDWIWKGDWQHLLNIIRYSDTSPRSKLHYYYDKSLEERWPRKWPRPEGYDDARRQQKEQARLLEKWGHKL